MPASIRDATEDDIDAMYEISCSVHMTPFYQKLIPASHYEKFRDRYTPSPARLARFYEKYIARFHDPTWRIWVAEHDGEVVGFTVAHDQGEVLILKGLFVADAYQGLGLGKSLFTTSCNAAKQGQAIILEVLEANERAIGLYERAGFQKGPAVDFYYGAPMIQMYKH